MARRGDLLAGRYRLEEPLASGGMARVWRGTDTVLGREVAIKVLHEHLRDDERFTARFRHEALSVARVSHPNIVAVYDTVANDDVDAIVLELVDGITLRQHLDDAGVLGPSDVVEMGVDLASALVAAHRAGVVHRDIKPANVLIGFDGSVKVTDFGIARAEADTELTLEGSVMGTASYLAPEQLEGRPVDGRADLYSLGLLLFEAATGRTPFPGDDPTSRALARLSVEPLRARDLDPSVPPALDATIDALLRRDPDERIPDAPTLVGRLERVRSELAGAPVEDPATARPRRAAGRRTVERPTEEAPVEETAQQPATRRHRRSRLGPVLLLGVTAVSVVLIYLLVQPTEDGEPGSGLDGAPTVPLPIVSAVPHDPQGTGAAGENDRAAPLAIDRDVGTEWTTEGYNQRDFGTKDGVGILLSTSVEAELVQLDVQTSTRGWSADVHVVGDPAPTRPQPGSAVARVRDQDGDARIRFPAGTTGRTVLLWVTDLGEGPAPHRFRLAEVTLTGRPSG